MPLAISLFPDIDGIDGLIEAAMPYFGLWLFALGFVLALLVIGDCLDRAVHRSPVDKLLRRRHARRLVRRSGSEGGSLGEGGFG